MTMPIKFDTLRYTNSLIEAGIPPEQAEAQAIALTQAMDEATVAPSELVLLRTDMIARIDMLRTEMNGKFEALRTYVDRKLTTVYWMVGLSLALHAVQITALIYIISRLP